jgi:alpha-1,2-mannosyltransferase
MRFARGVFRRTTCAATARSSFPLERPRHPALEPATSSSLATPRTELGTVDAAAMLARALDRASGLLTWKRARNYSLFVGVVYLAAWAYFSFAGTAPLNRVGEPLGGDYIAFHTAGRMLLDGRGGQLYDPTVVRAVQADTTLDRIPGLYDPLRNPPFFALVYVPFALLDLVPSFAAWTMVSMVALGAAVWLALDLVGLRHRWRAIACITFGFAPVYLGLVGGQNSSLALLLYVLVYRSLRHGREREAGVWAALGLFKPQLFLVLPLLFVASRRWAALTAYLCVAALLGVISVLVVGVDGLVSWAHVLFSNNLEAGIALKQGFRMHSFKSFFDLLLPEAPALALALSIVGSVVVLVPLLRLWQSRAVFRERALPLVYALAMVVGVLVDPHIFDYDLSILVFAALLVGTVEPRARWWFLGFYALLFLREPLPVGDRYLQPTVLVLACLAVWLWRRSTELKLVVQTPIRA